MKYNFNEIIDRTGTHSVKLDMLPEGAAPDTMPLWIADMDFPCAEPIINALHERIDKKIFGYTLHDNDRIKESVFSWFHKRFGWDIDKSSMFYSPGIVPAIGYLINILSEEGDGIIIQRPVYYPFTERITANKRTVINNPLIRRGNRYVMDFDDLEKKFADPKNKGLILCSPHNPVGRVWTEEELLNTVSIAKKYGKWIISDEIHCDLTRMDVKHTPLLKIAGEYKDRIVACTAPSKTFNLAGGQLSSIIISNPEYRKKWSEFCIGRAAVSTACNPFGLEAAIAGYTRGEEWLDQAREYIDINIKYVETFVQENLPRASVCKCEGTYLMWLDLKGYSSSHKELERLMIHKAKLFLDEGYIFGEEGIGFERINIAIPFPKVVDCMARLKYALCQIQD